ncbi:MAG: transposase [Cloacibacterium normanense]
MAGSMKLIAKRCFPNATQVVDRFHVQKLCYRSSSRAQIQYRWEAIDLENEIIKQAKDKKEKSNILYLKTTTPENSYWQEVGIYFTNAGKNGTENQNIRAKILFDEYPYLEKAYNLSDKLRKIYNQKIKNPLQC